MQALKNHIKRILRRIVPCRFPLLLHTVGRRFPVHVDMTEARAEATLSALHPDKGDTCLCHNDIDPVADLHIVIPVYNAAPYLRACLDSVYTQETRFTYFVSLVDDGSTDGSADILDAFRLSLRGTPMYDRTDIIHQPNGGPAAARNRALQHIRGRYVTFVDSDDMLMPGAIEALMSAAIDHDADITEGNTDAGTPTHGMACGKVYRAGLFRTMHFPRGYWFEDSINIFFLYPLCHRRIQVTGRHYLYRNNPASIMHSYCGDARAIDSLWVSRRVLADYFSCGHPATETLLADFLRDTLSTASHVSTLRNEQAMQAVFVILSHLAHTHFAPMLASPAIVSRLPFILRQTARALLEGDYRRFRTAHASACRF